VKTTARNGGNEWRVGSGERRDVRLGLVFYSDRWALWIKLGALIMGRKRMRGQTSSITTDGQMGYPCVRTNHAMVYLKTIPTNGSMG
jgi:hypothetical protein